MSSPVQATRRRPRFQREQRHELRYRLSIGLAEALSWVFRAIPQPLRYLTADRIGDLFRRSTHTYRDNVEANVSQVIDKPVDSQEVAAAVRSIFRTSSRNFADLITLPRVRRKTLVGRMSVTRGNWDEIDQAIAIGRGVIFLSAHLGCFDVVGQTIASRGYRLTIVTGRTTSRFIFDGVTHLRASKGAKLVEPTPSGVRNVIRNLRQGECAVFVADRDFFQNGREVTFFNRDTTLPPGPVRIARDTGALVVPIIPRRTNRAHEIEILPGFTVPRTDDLESDMQVGFDFLVDALEYGIRRNITQWVMFQRVWPEEAAPALRVFPVGSPLESELLEKVAQRLPERPVIDGPPIITRLRDGVRSSSDAPPPTDDQR